MKNEGNDQMLRRNQLQPGDMASIDQYVSALPGRLPHTKGKENKKYQYFGGTIFIDHPSSKEFLKHQVLLNAGETVMTKRSYEREVMSSGVRIKAYHANNVPFNSEEWKRDFCVQHSSTVGRILNLHTGSPSTTWCTMNSLAL
jgi:hypothetical protein